MMVQKFPNLLDLGEAGTETVFPVLRAYGLVNATRGTNFLSNNFPRYMTSYYIFTWYGNLIGLLMQHQCVTIQMITDVYYGVQGGSNVFSLRIKSWCAEPFR